MLESNGEFAEELWNDLNELVRTNDSFFLIDVELTGDASASYRIFNYRLASYTDFLAKNALECRGHMFEYELVQGEGVKMVRLAALPMEKFFNYRENPFTMTPDFTNVKSIQHKEDGSLISTYLHNGELRLKSKGGLNSTQAVDAMAWLNLPKNNDLREELQELTASCFTVNMEWCSPDNRIVLRYYDPTLVILNIRSMITGTYIDADTSHLFDDGDFPRVLKAHLTNIITSIRDVPQFVEEIHGFKDIEGFVLQLANGQHIKCKTAWYMALHHIKGQIDEPKLLLRAILDECVDDLRSELFDDELAIRKINEMEAKVKEAYNNLMDTSNKFHTDNQGLSRKDYAIKAMAEVSSMTFPLVMSLYLGKELDIPEYIFKFRDKLGLV